MSINDMIKTGTLVSGVIGGWLFATTYFATAAAMEQQSEKLNETMLRIQLDIAEDRLYRVRRNMRSNNIDDVIKEEELGRRVIRLEKRIGEQYD